MIGVVAELLQQLRRNGGKISGQDGAPFFFAASASSIITCQPEPGSARARASEVCLHPVSALRHSRRRRTTCPARASAAPCGATQRNRSAPGSDWALARRKLRQSTISVPAAIVEVRPSGSSPAGMPWVDGDAIAWSLSYGAWGITPPARLRRDARAMRRRTGRRIPFVVSPRDETGRVIQHCRASLKTRP